MPSVRSGRARQRRAAALFAGCLHRLLGLGDFLCQLVVVQNVPLAAGIGARDALAALQRAQLLLRPIAVVGTRRLRAVLLFFLLRGFLRRILAIAIVLLLLSRGEG